ncbi:MAG: multiple sugar transport system ATP-binding protein [Thermoleophilaceae bacterium]|jgi:ABC-type sugar transport system ATPase subunit|nr:multiple sugar transport system ATP-binding protein [Thermoleophilaceae bacterium]
MTALSLQSIWKRYGDVEAVRDVSIDVEAGELLALIGPSGCGKTSTCKMIAGLEDISDGDLLLSERRVNDLPSEQRNIAMVFEDYALYPRMNVFENVAFPLRVRSVRRPELRERVESILERMELTDVRHARVQDLSGGQQQRVSIARALVREPTVLIMDEPLSHLDVSLKGRLRSEIRVLQQQLGLTGVLVTHDQAEAMAMGDRIAVMHLGELRQCDTPHAVYDEPADMFVAGFIGEPPMNFVPGQIAGEGGAVRFVSESLEVELPARTVKRLTDAGVLGNDEREPAVIVGIRPEHISVARADAPASGAGSVFFAEWFGSFQAVMLSHRGRDDHWLTLLAEPDDDYAIGQPVKFTVDPEQLTFFDPSTERNVLADDAVGPLLENSVASE